EVRRNNLVMEDELMDVVDRHDNIIGQKKRSELCAENSPNCRAINVFLVNAQGQIWIPRRTAHKQFFPLHLDMSCGGCVRSSESYEDGMRREVEEELNIDIGRVSWHLLGHLTPYDDGVSMFMKVYELQDNETPQWNQDDFVESYWLWPWQIMDWVQNGEPVKDDLPLLVKRFYMTEADRVN
ncbi:MAG: NUDIX domain-containing protein, partial [Cyanobacteriota bacterium]|nr:NUDIX domain-containing protein [Cyanobacteriota bacterium]